MTELAKEVHLKDGSVANVTLVTGVSLALKTLWDRDMMGKCSVLELHSHAKDTNYRMDPFCVEDLKKTGLLDEFGRLNDVTKGIIISSVYGEGAGRGLQSPVGF